MSPSIGSGAPEAAGSGTQEGKGSGTQEGKGSGAPEAAGSGTESWLVVIDPQVIFASPDFADALTNIRRLAEAFGERVLVTRWLPTADRSTSWGEYFAAWPFADRPADDPLYALVPEAIGLSPHPTVDLPTFGKWGPELEALVGRGGRIVLAGVSTDCCVVSTALAAADAGARVTLAADACAGSTAKNHAAAVQVMSLYPPQITVTDTATLLSP